MEIRYRLVLCIQSLVLAAWLCACRETRESKTQDVKSQDENSRDEIAQAQAPTLSPPPPPPQVTAFVDHYAESGLELKDWVSGNLNKDTLPDLILLFTGRESKSNPVVDTLAPRPLVILLGTGEGIFHQASVNWNAVLCGTCGNRLTDPYAKIVIKDGYFSLEHASSDNEFGWKRVTTFKVADSLNTWVLYKDDMFSWNVAPEGEKAFEYHVIKTGKDFGYIPIDSFDMYSMDDRIQGVNDNRGFPLIFGPSPTYRDQQIVKGGIWHMLDYCTGNLSQGYMFFAKSRSGVYASDSEIEVDVLYHLVKNVVADDTCHGFAVKNEPSIRPGKAEKAKYDSAADTYHLGRDTIRFIHEKQPFDPNWIRLVFKRGRDTLILSGNSAGEHETDILYTGDINADGYLDFIKRNSGYAETTALYLSKKNNDGQVRMEVAGIMTFTE